MPAAPATAPPSPGGRPGLDRSALLRLAPFACLLALFEIAYFKGLFVAGDSFQAFAMFTTAYGEFLASGQLPQWLPQAAYGAPAEPYVTTFLGPIQLALMLLGAALRVTDAWALFYLGVFLESLVLVGGCLLLGSELYEDELAAVAVALWAALSLYWNVQVFWTHRALLHLPLLLFCALRLHRTGDLRHALRLALCLPLCLAGNLLYLAPVYALAALAFPLLLRLAGGRAAPLSWPGRAAWPECCLLLLCAGLFLALLRGQPDGAVFTAPGRDPVSGAVDLQAFLDFGGPALAKLPDFVLGRWAGHMQFLFYTGAPLAVLALLALRRVRAAAFLALAGLCALLLLLGLGRHGLLAYAAYWLPGMDRFRHLAFLLPMARLLLFFLAGYGLDWLLADPRRRGRDALAWLALAMAGILGGKLLLTWGRPEPDWTGYAPELACGLALLAVLGARLLREHRPRALALGLALAAAGDLLLAHQLLLVNTFRYERSYWSDPVERVEIWRARPPAFSPRRLAPWEPDPARKTFLTYALRQPVNNFTLTAVTGEDPCAPLTRIDYAMPGVLGLLERHAPGALAAANREYDPGRMLSAAHWADALADAEFRRACGCDGGKLMLETADGGRRDASGGVREYGANRLVLDVEAGEAGGTLYYADAFHPRWRAWVDGRPAEVSLARGAFKAVALPPGRHEVALAFYEPWRQWARFGLAGTLLAALGLLFAAGLRERRRQ